MAEYPASELVADFSIHRQTAHPVLIRCNPPALRPPAKSVEYVTFIIKEVVSVHE
jgi:hypothetical protein